jgi:hypothetical protein
MPKQVPNDGRMERVLDLWRTGIPTRAIQVAIAAEFQVSYRQVREYIRRVEKKMAEQQAEELPGKRAKVSAALEAFLERAIAAGDLRAQGVALERLQKVYLPEQPKSVSVSGSVAIPNHEGKTDEQVKAELEEMRKAQDRGKA